METKLTVPIASRNIDGAIQQIRAAVSAGAEMLELRVDYLESLNAGLVEQLISQTKQICELSLIVTCRDSKQGGAIDYPGKLRVEVLTSAVKSGADFIDFEYENFLDTELREKIELAILQSPHGRLILSAHDFKGKFDDIAGLYRHILTVFPAAIPKLVYTASHINDCFEAIDLLHTTSGARIIFCMGAAGVITRILAKKLGSLITFASVDEKSATASGQLTIEKFRGLYRYDAIDADTQLYGVIACPVAHSMSPVVHNGSFSGAELNKLYLPLLVEGGTDEFNQFMRNILNRQWLGFKGFSITIPHKENALNFVKQSSGSIETLAERIGSVNTVLIKSEGQLAACNTDYSSALDSIVCGMCISKADLSGMAVTVIGAGGVARAIVAGLADAGADITIYNRTVRRAKKLAKEFDCSYASLEKLSDIDARLVVNCTSIGMHPDIGNTPLAAEFVKKDMAVFDTVYNPVETLLLKQAKETGAATIDGVSMFVNQAAGQFKLFTSQAADTGLMRKTICDCLGGK